MKKPTGKNVATKSRRMSAIGAASEQLLFALANFVIELERAPHDEHACELAKAKLLARHALVKDMIEESGYARPEDNDGQE